MNESMNTFLKDSFGNNKLSRAQKQDLRELLERMGQDSRQLSQFREMAFDLAKEDIPSQHHNILNWLEVIMKAAMGASALPQGTQDQVYFSPGPNCRNQIEKAIDRVKHKLDICVFTISDDRIVDNIIAAHRRGVKVRVISDNDKSYDAGSDIERMFRQGLNVRIDKTDYHMHHKFAIIDDDFVFTGSYNWTRSAAEYNEENLVKLYDKGLLDDFQKEFDSLWKECESFSER